MNFGLNSWKGALIHIGIVLLLSFSIILYFFFGYLPSTTLHGQAIVVPILDNIEIDEAIEMLEQKGLRYEITDTVYSDKHDPNTVITQHPKGNSEVKQNRRIYLTINAKNPPSILITSEIYSEIRRKDALHVQNVLKSIGFRVQADTVDHPWKNFVIECKYQGKEVKPGQKIIKGSKLTIEIGNGTESDVENEEEEEETELDD